MKKGNATTNAILVVLLVIVVGFVVWYATRSQRAAAPSTSSGIELNVGGKATGMGNGSN